MKVKNILLVAISLVVIATVILFVVNHQKNKTEKLRQQKVAAELGLTYWGPITVDIVADLKKNPDVTNEEIVIYRNGISKLLELGPIMQSLFQKQIGADKDDRIMAATDDDRELIDRYGFPWCTLDQSKYCVALPDLKERASGVVPMDVSCADSNKVGTPFTVVTKGKDGGLIAKPYNEVWADELKKSASILREAAGTLSKIPREEKFANHLKEKADSFESTAPYPYARSDKTWVDALKSDSLLFIRVGPDETGYGKVGDKCDSRARFHFRLGIKSPNVGEVIGNLKPHIQTLENVFTGFIGDSKNYTARNVEIELPEFIDVMAEKGDDFSSALGTTTAQTLPNWCGEDGKADCSRGTAVYTNKIPAALSKDVLDKYYKPLIDKKTYAALNLNSSIPQYAYHEIFHNMGPKSGLVKPDTKTTYGSLLITGSGRSWVTPIEEMKAETGSLFIATYLYEHDQKSYTKEDYDDFILTQFIWCQNQILRASLSESGFQSPYAFVAAAIVGYMTEAGVYQFDEKTGEWSIDFEKAPGAITALAKKVGSAYAKTNADEIEKFFLYYTDGDGRKLLHQDRLVEVAGKKPSLIPEYKIKGL